MNDIVSAVVSDGTYHLILQKETDGHRYWELPGGSLDPGETPVAGMLREYEEETGNDPADTIQYVKGFRPYELQTARNRYRIFPHDIRVSEPAIAELSDEHLGSRWVPRHELPHPSFGTLTRPSQETLSYLEYAGDARYAIIGRPDDTPVISVSPGETADAALSTYEVGASNTA